MKRYKITYYKNGKKSFVLSALNKKEALKTAKKRISSDILDIKEISTPLSLKIQNFKRVLIKYTFSFNYPAYIGALSELSVLLKAGISLSVALEDVGKNTKEKFVKELLLNAAQEIKSGKSLSTVFKKHKDILGTVSVGIISMAENTGDLAKALEYMRDFYQKTYDITKRIKKALRYPEITFIAIIGAFWVLMVGVVPKFEALFNRLGADLPLPTRMLIGCEEFISNFGKALFVGWVGLGFLTLVMYKNSGKVKRLLDKITLKVLIVGEIIEYLEVYRFLFTFSLLLKSGIALLESLEIAKEVINNEILKEKIDEIISGIKKGRSFSHMIQSTGLLNHIAFRMIASGEEAGELDKMLENAANYYEDLFTQKVDNIQSALEPVLILVLGLLVLWIALGVFLPMWSISEAFS
ncbi:MAG: type II secretion system F family protein [Epsilonproteobacteria bacterium]|nr:type II secretion system F family protein [Campylobacterota bacterium]